MAASSCSSQPFLVSLRKEFLPTLQPRRKWQRDSPNGKEGDLVLLSEKETHRNDWPLARVIKTYPSDDGKVRQVDVETTRGGNKRRYLRPITEIVLLRSAAELSSNQIL